MTSFLGAMQAQYRSEHTAVTTKQEQLVLDHPPDGKSYVYSAERASMRATGFACPTRKRRQGFDVRTGCSKNYKPWQDPEQCAVTCDRETARRPLEPAQQLGPNKMSSAAETERGPRAAQAGHRGAARPWSGATFLPCLRADVLWERLHRRRETMWPGVCSLPRGRGQQRVG